MTGNGGLSALCITTGMVAWMHSYTIGTFALPLGQIMMWYVMYVWWRDVIREATFEGLHTTAVQKSHRIGMVLFIVSEVMFFFAFFWAFFHSSIVPAIQIGNTWPPQGIQAFNPWEVPLLNTLILLLSGCSVTWAHHSIVAGYRKEAIISLAITVGTGFLLYVLPSSWVYGESFPYFRFCVWIYVLLSDRIPWSSCSSRNSHALCVSSSTDQRTLHTTTPLRIRSCGLILTFCRCCLTFPICGCLLMRRTWVGLVSRSKSPSGVPWSSETSQCLRAETYNSSR